MGWVILLAQQDALHFYRHHHVAIRAHHHPTHTVGHGRLECAARAGDGAGELRGPVVVARDARALCGEGVEKDERQKINEARCQRIYG